MATAVSPTPFEAGFRLTNGNTLNRVLGFPVVSSQDAITATAGGGKTSAFPLTATMNRVSTVATTADSVLLPASSAGKSVFIANGGASAMQVFGAGTDTINDVATGTGISQPAGSNVTYYCTVAGKWYANASDAANFGALTATTFNGNTITVGSDTLVGRTTTDTLTNKTLTDFINTDCKRVTTQTDVTSSTTLANITGLSVALTAGATYSVHVYLPCTITATPGAKFALANGDTLTATSFSCNGKFYNNATVAAASTTTTLGTAVASAAAAGTDAVLEAVIVVNAAGTLVAQIAQNTSNGTATSALINGYMLVTRIA